MIDTRRAVAGFRTLESLAVLDRVSSTNTIARRVVAECVANDLKMPQAIIVAREQLAGRGRNERRWSSPAGKGIYATTMITRPASELPLVPLEIANIVASFLREVFGIDARVKWPNDVLVEGRKIAGILIEARVQEDRAFLLVGTGINVEHVVHDERPNAIAIADVARHAFTGTEAATEAFVRHLDARLSAPLVKERVLAEWMQLTVHERGDTIACATPAGMIRGAWAGIDEHGRALLDTGSGIVAVSAGEFVAHS